MGKSRSKLNIDWEQNVEREGNFLETYGLIPPIDPWDRKWPFKAEIEPFYGISRLKKQRCRVLKSFVTLLGTRWGEQMSL